MTLTQQAVEKGLKALLISKDIPFPKTHSLNLLIALLKEDSIQIPEYVKEAVILSDYAVETMYPGEYEPVSIEEYDKAVELAEQALQWVEEKVV